MPAGVGLDGPEARLGVWQEELPVADAVIRALLADVRPCHARRPVVGKAPFFQRCRAARVPVVGIVRTRAYIVMAYIVMAQGQRRRLSRRESV